MKGLETGKDKIQKICDALKKETLDPAKQEAREIIENAHMQASEILSDAKKKALELLEQAEKEMEEKKRVSQASLSLACRQVIELLKQKIEKEIFNQELYSLISKEMVEPKIIAQLINTLIRSIEERGIEDEFIAKIPKEVSPRIINELLAKRVLEKLANQTVVASEIKGGAQIQLKKGKITVDISDEALYELISGYIRRDLRDLVFSA